MYLVAQENAPLTQVADLIRADAGFSAEALRLANSPLFGARAQISTISHALCMIGFGRLYTMVITLSLSGFVGEAKQNPLLRRCWRHSLGCALACEEMALAAGLNRDYLYTAGLLHDVGRLALAAAYPGEYARMLEVAAGQLDLLEFERNLFDIDHCQAGEWLMEEWVFPAEFREIAGRYHSEPDQPCASALCLTHVACRMADMLQLQVAGPAPEWDFASLTAKFSTGLKERLLSIPDRIRQLEAGMPVSAAD